MILSRIYSNDNRFKSVKFNEGFNLIVGKVKEYDRNDMHNLGKTSIVELIDFLLLKQIDKSHRFRASYDKFINHEFYLELKLNNGEYLTIKRNIKNDTKIYFKESKVPIDCLNLEEDEWDRRNLALGKAKDFLNEKLEFDVLKNYKYRTYIHYFLKKEKEFSPNFESHHFGNSLSWKVPLLELVGINSSYYKDKVKLEEELNKLNAGTNDKNDISVQLMQNEAKKRLFEKKLADLEKVEMSLNYYAIDKNITKEMVDNVVYQIANLNSKRYNLEYDILKLENSLSGEEGTIDLDELKEIFNEVKLCFPKELSESYDSLVKFNKQIFSERKENVEKTLLKKRQELLKIDKELDHLNQEQKRMLEKLKEKNLYTKVLQQQKEKNDTIRQLEEIEKTISEIKQKIELIKKITVIKADIDQNIEKLKLEILDDNNLFFKIRDELASITQKIFDNRIGVFTIPLNGKNNPDFNLKYINTNTDTYTSEDEGGTYGDWLEACFCISIIVVYAKHSFYRFLFQDGIMESGDDRRKRNFILELKRLCEVFKIQYISTAIEHEINSKEVKEVLDFSEDVVLELDDRSDGSGTLYGFLF